ncbi:sensor histidine kinase [Streptomyces sp. 8N616]|uniref:sensor histidine kinase n=1 Tax=Streptomyces sp. 8N616 TaxID=3457414 RepID=UPI003FD510AC
MDAAFVLLLGGSLVRFLTRDAGDNRTGWILALFLVFGVLYLLGRFWAPAPRRGGRPTTRYLLWLGAVLAVWVVLLALVPSATWCAMPLLFTGLHNLPVRTAVPLAAGLTALVVASEVRVSTGVFNPNLVIAPVAIGAVATAVLVHSRRQTARQRLLIDDLFRARRELAVAERQAGILAERQRLSAEIHDTLAQSLSSQQMLLQAAERLWHTSPEAARGHVRDAAEIAARGLAEARRFVRDLAPPDLAESTLVPALRALAEREDRPGLAVAFRLDGTPGALPERVGTALLRVAQGALANVREHAHATRAALTLTCVDDRIAVDIADDGRGFDVRRTPRPGPGRTRGHGLPAMRLRARQAGGTLTVESAPGEGTTVTVSVPLAPDSAGKDTP